MTQHGVAPTRLIEHGVHFADDFLSGRTLGADHMYQHVDGLFAQQVKLQPLIGGRVVPRQMVGRLIGITQYHIHPRRSHHLEQALGCVRCGQAKKIGLAVVALEQGIRGGAIAASTAHADTHLAAVQQF